MKSLAEYLAKKAKSKIKNEKRRAKAKILWVGEHETRKQLVKKLDTIFSLFIRLRDKAIYGGACVICRKRPIEHCFHWITRGSYSTRWDERNSCGSCAGCNLEETFRPLKYRDIHISMVGKDERERLEDKARGLAKFSRADLREMFGQLKAKMGA